MNEGKVMSQQELTEIRMTHNDPLIHALLDHIEDLEFIIEEKDRVSRVSADILHARLEDSWIELAEIYEDVDAEIQRNDALMERNAQLLQNNHSLSAENDFFYFAINNAKLQGV